jgi:hypothetical protein
MLRRPQVRRSVVVICKSNLAGVKTNNVRVYHGPRSAQWRDLGRLCEELVAVGELRRLRRSRRRMCTRERVGMVGPL